MDKQKFLNELINREINSSKINESSKSTVNLEKLIEMYDKGLLTDEEFIMGLLDILKEVSE